MKYLIIGNVNHVNTPGLSNSATSCEKIPAYIVWRLFDATPYELRTAKSNIAEDEVVRLLDYSKIMTAWSFHTKKPRQGNGRPDQ